MGIKRSLLTEMIPFAVNKEQQKKGGEVGGDDNVNKELSG